MQTAPIIPPIVKDIVLIGGGHAHVHVLKSFGLRPIPGVRLTLVTRDVETPYSGMLPGFIAGFYSFDETHVDLRPLARFAGARLLHDSATGLDLGQRRVLMHNHPPLAYDLLSIDIGSTPQAHGVPGALEHATPVKPIAGLARRWADLLARVRTGHGPKRFVTVGAGAAGIEVTLAVRHRLREILKAELGQDPDALSFTILARGSLLVEHNPSVQARFRRILAEQGVQLVTGVTVDRLTAGVAHAADGRSFAFDEAFWVTEAGAAPWIASTGLATDPRGFIAIDAHLRSRSHAEIFAAGDIAGNADQPLPKAGVFAVRQGAILSENLRHAVLGEPLLLYRPQRRFLSLISTGGRYAVASRGSVAAEGAAMWRWKDAIDRRWMRMYQQLDTMAGSATGPALPPAQATADDPLAVLATAPMRCGGCGAKVGKDALARVLTRLAPKSAPDVVVGLDAADDAAILVPPPGKMLVQTVDFFRAFVDDPYLFGRIAANHALGDIYAMGGTPLSALAIATVPHAAEEKVEEDLFQILRGGLDVLEAAGAVLAGGHSAEGAELALGFTINGAVDPDRILRKGGARAGDVLILTKPLGTGALLAAEMRGKARAPWIETALATMQQSAAAAARLLLDHGATACTDVTGFGLAGHLHEMLSAAGLDADLDLSDVPALPGALDVLGQGIASSLAPDNLRLRRAIVADAATPKVPRFALLFDPQTAGGLLATVPAEHAAACLARLQAGGHATAAIIGRITPRAADTSRIRLRS